MGLLRLEVFGSPAVFHDGSRLTFALRKAQALLLYLAVEGGLHPRSKLAALLWPDSEPASALHILRNALALLQRLLADPGAEGVAALPHVLSEHDLLGLNPQAPLELDLEVVQQAWKTVQEFSALPPEPERTRQAAQIEHGLALVRGPFLDGFWLREETAFDAWVQVQQRQWQLRLQLLCDRLSSWQEAGGELEQARATLLRWLALDPLAEEAYRRLMQVHLALGDAIAAGRVYAACRARLAQELHVKPSPETLAVAERLRTTAPAPPARLPSRSSTLAESRPAGKLLAPLVGRAAAFRQLVGSLQQARGGQPQAVLVVGEAGIGKTRLASEFVGWARAQGAEVLSGHAIELGGRLPYQPLVEALRVRLEAENAPEDLLEDLWLAELARLLPELRVRSPDLPAPTEDELIAKLRLFEAVARLLDTLAQRAPLLLFLEDLHWMYGASLDLLRYLGHAWITHSSRVLLLGTVRSEELAPGSQLAAELATLGRDLPVSRVPLQPLSQAETRQLVQALVGEGEPNTRSAGELHERGPARPSPSQEPETRLSVLGDLLFAHTDGQPLYLLETLKLLREREWLVPRLAADGVFRLEPSVGMTEAVAQEQSRRELLPPSVRAMIQARLAKLVPPARQLVLAGAVLGNQASAKLLWQVAEVEGQEGIAALEEAVKSGILREEQAGAGRLVSYRFGHDLIRDVVYAELGAARRQVLHQRALARLEAQGAPAAELTYHALLAGEDESASRYSIQAGDEALAVFAIADAIGRYEQARALLQEQQRMQTVLEASEVEHLYVCLGRAYASQNAWQQAQQAYEELVAYAQTERLPTLVSRSLNRLSILAVQRSNDKPQVRALLEEAWRLAQTSHDQRALAETEWNLAQITGVVWEDPASALPHGEQALSLARKSLDQELETRSLSLLGLIHIRGGDFEEAIRCLEASLVLYARLRNEQSASRELSLAHFLSGSPPTQTLTNRATEGLCWGHLAFAQVHAGQVQSSLRSGRLGLAFSKESKNVWAQVNTTFCLTYGLLDAGMYEEALVLMQQTMALARTLPPTVNFQRFLTALGSTYQAVQQWEEAQAALEEAVAVAETLGLRPTRVPALSQLCMNWALAGDWEAAYRSAVKAIAIRKGYGAALIPLDFSPQYETEALLRGGEECQAREEVQRLGERVGSYQRFRIVYLRSLATIAAWEGQSERAIDHLCEAAQLAAELGLPGEQWQIQAALGSLYEAAGKPAQADTAWAKASRIVQGLAEGIGDKALRMRFLAGSQIQPVLRHT